MRVQWITYLLLLIGFGAHSQTELKASPSTQRILIGDQFTLSLSAEVSALDEITWPATEEIGSGLLLNRSGIDTTERGDILLLQEEWVITSFDSGFVVIPPLTLSVNGEPVQSDPVLVQVDMPRTQEEYLDIVDPLSIQRPWWYYALMGLGALVVVSLFALVMSKWTKNKSVQSRAVDKRTFREKAIDAANGLVEETQWDNNAETDAAYSKGIRLLYAYITRELGANTAAGDFTMWSAVMEKNPHYSGDTQKLRQLIERSNEVRFGGLPSTAEENKEWALQLSDWIRSATVVQPVNTEENVDVAD
ncbi:hypothetical protein [Phaeocystidibacter marisrubri]|uniref:Protein BatD n=1 Tax=Phaeocystidibacter marisrubri TaxID=1577780 RepID=A0A6L3ZFU6_9FLAO|nr:hypothetical protein [Phaeocystidibacter marisrubri]KAB2816277.1 protein BatD [Phaeocystidibacter marisrubri]GGH68217.1 hypothetical protein GCM10011318_08010 [Phaeocystidibacter marisrubri]